MDRDGEGGVSDEETFLCVSLRQKYSPHLYTECIKVFKVSLKFEYSVLATSEIACEVCACV